MNIAEYSIRNPVISWTLVVLLVLGGAASFLQLGQLEFPEFPIPQAMVLTAYPGASPEQVEEEVTLPLERAIQQLEYVKTIDSVSSAGLSQISIELLETSKASDQPQIWDELRRKIGDAQRTLSPGVLPSLVNDDFSDVFGVLFNISSTDYSYRELENYADYIRRDLSLIKGVKKISLAGTVTDQVIIEMSESKLATLGINPARILSLIQNQNVVSNAGRVLVEGLSIRIHPTGEFQDLHELEQLLISNPGSSELIYLGDIATISRKPDETPTNLYRSHGDKAISMGISFSKGVNVVDVGKAVNKRLAELEYSRPVGIDLAIVYDQPAVVEKSVADFLINLVEAVVIVIVVLLFTMGLRSGLLMGTILLLTILGTFIGMNLLKVELQLISLGALIIALGMLVDNAIVVTEGVLVGLQKGLSRIEAVKIVVSQNQWPLLGATIIAVIAFAPIGLSPNSTGDFLISLFQVLLIALLISWVLAITITPLFCYLMFSEPSEGMVGDASDPYKGALFTVYRSLLNIALRHRLASLALIIAALVAAIIGFGSIKQSFFPPSNTPIFFVDVWQQEGTDIRETEKNMQAIEQEVMNYQQVVNLTTVMGMGAQRFVLTYAPEKMYSSYGQLIIEVADLNTIRELIPEMRQSLETGFPDIDFKFKLLENGPAPAARIEARFFGSDPKVLRRLAAQAIEVAEAEPSAYAIRNNWREQVNIIRPQFDEAAARRSGLSKQSIDQTMLVNFSGKQIGVYRDGSHLLPIVARSPEAERLNANHISDLQVWSDERNTFVPVSQAVTAFATETENPLIMRRNLKRALTVLADIPPFSEETADSVRQKILGGIEAIPLPAGYSLEWGGEYESSRDAREGIFSSLPVGYLIMFLITVFLFSTIRQPIAIWSTVPLSIIGIAAGLLLLRMPFSFTALLGMLSLSGMIVKNGIVLVEQINIEAARESATAQSAILDACVSRVRPVCMAALTTMLGMIPLVFDAFFSSMAVTIIFGLGFATVLTLVVLPVIYALLYRIRFDQA